MLIELSVKNIGPFRDGFTLDLRGGAGDELPDNVLETRNCRTGVLSSAMVFGPNGAGKTTIIRTLNTIRDIALGKAPVYNPFMHNGEPSEISVTFTDEADTLFQYSVAFNDRITSESASFSPNGRITKVFTRTGDRVEPGSKFSELKSIKTEENVAFLHTACLAGDMVCGRIQDWFSHCIFTIPEFYREKVTGLLAVVMKNIELKADLKTMLRMAGFKIADMDENGITYEYPDRGRCTVPYSEESLGTLEAILVFYSVYYGLKRGALIVSDCIGVRMQSELTRFMLKQFKKDSNVSKSQIIAVSHDSALMSTDVLRRDQMFIVSRNDISGSSAVHSVSEFKGIRKGSDIAKAFENGRFDELPSEQGSESIDSE